MNNSALGQIARITQPRRRQKLTPFRFAVVSLTAVFLFIYGAGAAQAEVDRDRLSQAIVSYYNNQGKWAGVFRMTYIARMEIHGTSKNRYTIQVRYGYTPIPGKPS